VMLNESGMWTMRADLPVSFTIHKSTGLFDKDNLDILGHGNCGAGSRRLIVIDLKVSELYLKQIVSYFEHHGVEYHVTILDAVETNKNLEALVYLLGEIERFALLRRNEPIIAIGGGVLLDVVGMAAGLYRRGVPYIRVPTTLLGLVDGGIGAKTGINFQDRRNRLGSYYPPVAVYLDITFLKTLEPIEISSGMGEILKMAIVKDAELFGLLEYEGKALYQNKFIGCKSADEVINRSVKGMKDELQTNLWESDLKRYVDFGHSFSPIIEMRSLVDDEVPSLTHGQAVALDVIFSCVISMHRGMLIKEDVIRVITTARAMNLPIFHPYFGIPTLVLEALKDTMKHRNGDQNLPVPRSIGDSVFINDVTFDEIKTASISMRSLQDEVEL